MKFKGPPSGMHGEQDVQYGVLDTEEGERSKDVNEGITRQIERNQSSAQYRRRSQIKTRTAIAMSPDKDNSRNYAHPPHVGEVSPQRDRFKEEFSDYSTGQLPETGYQAPALPSLQSREMTQSVVEQAAHLLDEKIQTLQRFNKNMDKSLRELERLNTERLTTKSIQRSYEWNKANMDIKDWEKFRKENATLITNLRRKAAHEQRKAEMEEYKRREKEIEEAKRSPPSSFTKQNVIKASFGIFGFLCLFITLHLWRQADMHTLQLKHSDYTYDQPSNKAL